MTPPLNPPVNAGRHGVPLVCVWLVTACMGYSATNVIIRVSGAGPGWTNGKPRCASLIERPRNLVRGMLKSFDPPGLRFAPATLARSRGFFLSARSQSPFFNWLLKPGLQQELHHDFLERLGAGIDEANRAADVGVVLRQRIDPQSQADSSQKIWNGHGTLGDFHSVGA